jgi:hypothetical protein
LPVAKRSSLVEEATPESEVTLHGQRRVEAGPKTTRLEDDDENGEGGGKERILEGMGTERTRREIQREGILSKGRRMTTTM